MSKSPQDFFSAISTQAFLSRAIYAAAEFSLADHYDLRLFAVFGGKERTWQEFKTLIESAGLKITRSRYAAKLIHIIECEKN